MLFFSHYTTDSKKSSKTQKKKEELITDSRKSAYSILKSPTTGTDNFQLNFDDEFLFCSFVIIHIGPTFANQMMTIEVGLQGIGGSGEN